MIWINRENNNNTNNTDNIYITLFSIQLFNLYYHNLSNLKI